MTFAPRRLPFDRAQAVELRLRARAEQLRPTEKLEPAATPVALCHACATIVFAGDSAAMAGGYLFHENCLGRGADSFGAS